MAMFAAESVAGSASASSRMSQSSLDASRAAEIGPIDVWRGLQTGELVVVDVREPDEHARERIDGAKLLPLSRFDPELAASWVTAGQNLVLHCRGGRRSAEACRLVPAMSCRGAAVASLAGGIDAWKAAGLPVIINDRVARVSVMRQVQLAVGVSVLAGSVVAWLVHPVGLAVPMFFGAGLIFAGATGTCALAGILARMPWNRPAVDKSSCEVERRCRG